MFIPAAIAVALVLTSCGPDSGTVTEKEHRPGYFTSSPGYTSCTTSGKTTTCHYVPPTMIWHPQCWRIEFVSPEGKTGSDCVSQARYRTVRVGQEFAK